MPPAASFVTGDHIELRARLGLLTRPLDAERRAADASVSAWRALLVQMGLLAEHARPGSAAMTAALYGFLARTPARLIGVSLADAVGDRRPQNVPGTSDEYPNWRIPLADGAGRALLLEDLVSLPQVREITAAIAAARTPKLTPRPVPRRPWVAPPGASAWPGCPARLSRGCRGCGPPGTHPA